MMQKLKDIRGRTRASHWKGAAFAVALTMTILPLTSTVGADPLEDALAAANGVACAHPVAAEAVCAPEGRVAWSARYSTGEDGAGFVQGVAASPDGSTVFVAGSAPTADTEHDMVTLAYDADTGDVVWEASYNGPANGNDVPAAAAVSPDGATVFVTGTSGTWATGITYTTVAYDAATGDEKWVADHGPAGGMAFPESLTVSPDGSRVYVTGSSAGWDFNFNVDTVALDAATGSDVWSASYDGPAGGFDSGFEVGVSPDGSQVFVTGGTTATATGDYATIAYDSAGGNEQWVALYDGPGQKADRALGLGVSPDGALVYVTGRSTGSGTSTDYATIAYDTATGTPAWTARYDGPGGNSDNAWDLAVGPEGDRVYVTGSSRDGSSNYGTVAYDATDGSELWAAHYDGPGERDDQPVGLAVTPDGSAVIVTGTSEGDDEDYGTVTYNTADGSIAWEARYHGGGQYDRVYGLAVSPDSSRAYVIGNSRAFAGGDDFLTIAYETAAGLDTITSLELPLSEG